MTADLVGAALDALTDPHVGGHRCTDGLWWNPNAGTRTPCPTLGHLRLIAEQVDRYRQQVHTAAHDDTAARVVAEGFTGLTLADLSADDAVAYHHAGRLALEALAAHLDPTVTPPVPVLDIHAEDPDREAARYAAAVEAWRTRR